MSDEHLSLQGKIPPAILQQMVSDLLAQGQATYVEALKILIFVIAQVAHQAFATDHDAREWITEHLPANTLTAYEHIQLANIPESQRQRPN